MIPYFLLILVPLLFSFVSIEGKSTLRVRVGNTRAIGERSAALPVFFALLTLLLVLRSETLGRDLGNYKYMFEGYSRLSFRTIFRPAFLQENDWLFVALNLAFSKFSKNYHSFIAFVGAITILPIAFLYCEDRRKSAMQIAVFLSLSNFVMFFSGIRQSLAVTAGVISYKFVKEKKLLPYLLWVFIATSFHHSGVVLLLLYPIYHLTLRRKHLLIIAPIIIVILVFNKQVFTFLDRILVSYSDKYLSDTTDTGAYTSLVLFALFTVFCFVISDEQAITPELNGLRNILLLTVVFQCFAPIHTLAMRLNYYFMIFTPITLSKCVSNPNRRFQQVAHLGEVVITVFFTVYFLWVAYHSSITGVSSLDTYPYRFFWQN